MEARQAALEEGLRALREVGLESKHPNLRAIERLSQVNLERCFDVIWAFSTLIHMDDQVLDECCDFIGRHLAPSGSFYGNVQLGNEPEGEWLHFPIVWRSLEFYEAAARRHGLELADLGPLRSLGHVSGSPVQDNMTMLRLSLGTG